ncbi:MAG: DUF5362 family protein [Parafilimonas sp.]
MEDNLLPNTFALQIDNSNIPYLNEAAKWGKFLAIIGFIFCALLILCGLFAGTFLAASFTQVDSELASLGSLGTGIFTGWLILFALLYFFPSFYLFNFALKMQAAIRNNDQINLNASFKNLKSCFKFWGVLFIIILCFYAVVLILALVGGAFVH